MQDQRENAEVTRDKSLYALSRDWLTLQQHQWKESTYVRYRNIVERHIVPAFGPRDIGSITRAEVLAFCNGLLSSGSRQNRGLAPKTVSCILSALKCIFLFASRDKDISTADLKNLSIRQEPKNLRVFSLSEQQRLNQYLRSRSGLTSLGILLALYTGLRIGELCALRWEDISLTEHCLYVRRTMQRLQTLSKDGKKTQIQISSPKSRSSERQIPLPDELIPLLEKNQKPGNCYFLTGSPELFVEPRTMENRFKAVMQACHIQGATFHTCCHTFATRCIELGFDIKSLSEILGHSSVTITMNRYVHPSMEFKRENMNRFRKRGSSETAPETREMSMERRFDSFVAAYPVKSGRAKAYVEFIGIAPDMPLLERMILAIQDQKRAGVTMPAPATWLKRRGWETAIPEEEPA